MFLSFTLTNRHMALVILAALFFMEGVLTALNDILIPHLKMVFQLSYFQVMCIQLVWFSVYLTNSYAFGLWVRRTSYKAGIVGGFLLAAVGAELFFMAWYLDVFSAFLVALFIVASGGCLLQVVSNPYGMALGDPETKYQRMMWLHAFFAIGCTIAPLVAGPEILDESRLADWQLPWAFTETQLGAGSVLLPYGVLGVTLALLGLISFCLPLPDFSKDGQKEKITGGDSAWRYPHTVFGAVTAFFYIGTEVLIGSFIINYALSEQVYIGDMALSVLVSIYWGGILAGRLFSPWLMAHVRVAMMLVLTGVISAILLLASILSAGLVAVVLVVLVGLFNSVMYPVIYSLSIKDMPPAVATQASGIVSTAGIGGALIPLLGGLLADTWGINAAFILSVFCYLEITAYGIFACRCDQKESTLRKAEIKNIPSS